MPFPRIQGQSCASPVTFVMSSSLIGASLKSHLRQDKLSSMIHLAALHPSLKSCSICNQAHYSKTKLFPSDFKGSWAIVKDIPNWQTNDCIYVLWFVLSDQESHVKKLEIRRKQFSLAVMSLPWSMHSNSLNCFLLALIIFFNFDSMNIHLEIRQYWGCSLSESVEKETGKTVFNLGSCWLHILHDFRDGCFNKF
jgi:hypothetical protein